MEDLLWGPGAHGEGWRNTANCLVLRQPPSAHFLSVLDTWDICCIFIEIPPESWHLWKSILDELLFALQIYFTSYVYVGRGRPVYVMYEIPSEAWHLWKSILDKLLFALQIYFHFMCMWGGADLVCGVCMWVRRCVPIHPCKQRSKEDLGVLFILPFTLLFWDKVSHWTRSQLTFRIPLSLSSRLRSQACAAMLGFYMSARDSSLGPHACTDSLLMNWAIPLQRREGGSGMWGRGGWESEWIDSTMKWSVSVGGWNDN